LDAGDRHDDRVKQKIAQKRATLCEVEAERHQAKSLDTETAAAEAQ
jgi:hypothetical protein